MFFRTASVFWPYRYSRVAANATGGFRIGKATLKSAGQLAFRPAGVLFVGDTLGALNEKIAAALGTTADQILINDVVVNPESTNVYLSISRAAGRRPLRLFRALMLPAN